MRTKAIAEVGASLPWLERFSPSSSAPDLIEVKDFPFTMGRNAECDYQIVSSRVSREHAEIVRTQRGFALRDLGSTNGTFVNGKRVEQSSLGDGDLIVIADVELTFRVAGAAATGKTVTQIMPGESAGDEQVPDVALSLILAVRAGHERLLCRGTRSRFQPVVDLLSGEEAGFEALSGAARGPDESATSERILEGTECRLAERVHQVERLLAAEQSAQFSHGKLLLVHLEPAEVGADLVPESLARLAAASGGKRIVAAIPDSAVVDIPYFRDFLSRLRQLGVAVAYSGMAGNQHQVMAHQELAPDYLQLAPALARGVDKSTQRQQQIRAILEAAAEHKTQVIATGVHTEIEAATCRELGCHFAQGDHYGRDPVLAAAL